ncbi:hypothetical protein N7454_006864 [Penicillium verhagenii]|nr:hypothetical protein N7454_006864 [Penicillium verhagenii]
MAPTDSKAEAIVEVNVDELRNSKDAMLMRLMALQSYIADLSKAYLEHANSVISGGPATIDIPDVPSGLRLGEFERPSSPSTKLEPTKKRKRAPADPNAPKRALTPYFLYMQSNRPKIAADLGETAKPKDVADEGTRRWQEMPAPQKDVWKELYLMNYEKYKADMAAYKAGKLADEEHEQDPAATQLQADFADAPKEASDKDSSSDEEEEDKAASDSDESRESSPSPVQPPPKEKTPRSTKRQRVSDSKKEVPESAVKQTSPVKRNARRGKAAELAAKETPAAAEAKTPKSKGKKRKSDV